MARIMDRRAFLRNASVGAAALAGSGMLAGYAGAGARTAHAATVAKTDAPKNRVCEILGIEKPVISAPMYSLTSGKFVAAVSEAGGMGMLNMETLSPDTPFAEPDEIYRLAEQHIQDIKDNTDKPFALSMPYSEVPGILDLVLEAQPTLVRAYGVNQDDIYELRDAGIKLMGSAYDSDPEALVEMAEEYDIIYLKCYGCGGSIPHNRANTMALLEKFAGLDLAAPIVPGGGIANAAGAMAVTAAGAEGVFVGTRFLASEENPMHPDAKQALLDISASELIEIDFTSAFSHCSPTPKALELRERSIAGEDNQELSNESYNMYTHGMLGGKLDEWMLSVDDSVDSITEILTCKQIVDELGDAVLNMQAMMA